MDPRKVAVPLLAFAGGAVLGRPLGLKTLMRGAMAAAAVTGMTRPAYGANGDARRLTGKGMWQLGILRLARAANSKFLSVVAAGSS